MEKILESVMSGKLKHIPAINTNPLGNEFCEKMSSCKSNIVCQFCYSRNMLKTYRANCGSAWTKNGLILSSKLIDDKELPTINTIYFRFSAHGELINEIHFVNLCRIAKKNPRTRFVLWTKRKDIIKNNINEVPSNLGLIYSNPVMDRVSKKPPHGFNKVFNVVTKNVNGINCAGKKCWTCTKCYDPDNTETCIIEKLRVR